MENIKMDEVDPIAHNLMTCFLLVMFALALIMMAAMIAAGGGLP